MHPLATRANRSEQQDNKTHPYKVLQTTNPRKAAILSKLVDANRKAKGLWTLIDHAGTHAGPWTWDMYQLMNAHRGRPEPEDMVHRSFLRALKTSQKVPSGFKLKRAKGAAQSVMQAHNRALSELINIGIASPSFMTHAHTLPPPPNYGVPISNAIIEKIVSSGNMKLIDNLLHRPSTNAKITKLVGLKMLYSGKVELVKEALRRYTFPASELKDVLDGILMKAKRCPLSPVDPRLLRVLFEHILANNSMKNTQFATRFLQRYVSLPGNREVNESIVMLLINRLGANARNVDIHSIVLKKPSVSTIQSLDLLLRKGAPASGTNAYGQTPLHIVRSHQFAEILMKHGANAYAPNWSGSTPMRVNAFWNMLGDKRVLEVIQRYATQNNRSSKKARKNI
jgi:hypothetical protein